MQPWLLPRENSTTFHPLSLPPHFGQSPMKEFLHWMRNSERLYKIAYRKYSSAECGLVAIVVAKELKEGLKMESDPLRTRIPGSFPGSDTVSNSG